MRIAPIMYQVINNRHKAVVFTSLGQLRYISALQYVDAVVGNTSSGIVEAPSFNVGTINIGERQKGRVQAESIINCDSTYNSIKNGLLVIYSNGFKEKLPNIVNPYYKKNSSFNIKNVLKSIDFKDIIKKKFRDL